MSIDTGKIDRADAAINEVLHSPDIRFVGDGLDVASHRDQDTMRHILLQEHQESLRNESAARIVGRSLCAGGCATLSFSTHTDSAVSIGLALVVILIVTYWHVQQRWTRSQIRVIEKWLLSQSSAVDQFIRWKWEASSPQANTASLLLKFEPFVWMSLTCVISLLSVFGRSGFIR